MKGRNGMRRMFTGLVILAACIMWGASAGFPERATVSVRTDMTANTAYDDGFAYDVMRAGDGAGVMLNDMVLIEDDGPGAGMSEKGTFLEDIHKGVLARKTFPLEDPTAVEAHIALMLLPLNKDRAKQVLFHIILNGTRIEGEPVPWFVIGWQFVKVPTSLLKKGNNTVVVGCDAPKGEGYQLFISRADEYEGGGGAFSTGGGAFLAATGKTEMEVDEKAGKVRVISIGKNSAKSMNGGRSWTRMKLGNTNDVVGEYTIRLNIKRYKSEGSLLSPPIDLWKGIQGHEAITPICGVDSLSLSCEGEIPEGTSLTWQYRTASTPDIMSGEWGEFTPLGVGAAFSGRADNNGKRYVQWRAVLKTKNPLRTPVVKKVVVSRRLTFTPPSPDAFYVWKYENAVQRYSSVPFAFEKWNEPKLKKLRDRLKLDEVISGATTDFDVVNRVRHLVSVQWHHGNPTPGYPEWNALDILDRRDRIGVGGMCIQFSITYIQSMLSLGYQARHINMFAHETTEVYVDDLGKWVHVDPESVFDSYEYETTTGMPVNTLEQHRYFLKENGLSPENPIDWQSTSPWLRPANGIKPNPQPLSFSTYTGWINDSKQPDYPPQHRLAGFLRMMPRNDYFSRPYPRPLNQGMYQWPWTGYLNWYDGATPRKLQYGFHTDREADFYPTLNRVQFAATNTETEGKIAIDMVTFAPNFDGFEIDVDDTGWKKSPASFVWSLNRSSVNTLQMRVANKLGPRGKPSIIQVMWNYKEPFSPRKW
jgi:hypothetical protein